MSFYKTIPILFFILFSNAMHSGDAFSNIFHDLIHMVERLVFGEKCLEHFGCFYSGPPFFDVPWRPIPALPFDEDKMDTKFFLYTKFKMDQPSRLLINKTAILHMSNFRKQAPFKIYVHGYNMKGADLSDQTHFKMVKDAFLNAYDYNVILVDWTISSGNPYYQAFANARVVGAQLAQFIKFLKRSAGVEPENVHLIGYGIGAHICGWAGERVNGLGRITGLDPAGPYFRNSPPAVRLDPTDALFVDVIHTDGANFLLFGFGYEGPLGHADFYPNGGSSQPGCENEKKVLSGPELPDVGLEPINIEALGFLMPSPCSHSRSVELFVESITTSTCKFTATACPGYQKFIEGACDKNQKNVMGLNANPEGIRNNESFYLYTNSRAPFCEGGTLKTRL